MLAMAAYGAHCKIEGFAFLPITSFTMACTTFVGQNLGAKQYDRAKRGARFCIIIAVVMAELIGLCYYIWASQLISLFDSTPGVVALGVQQARTVHCSTACWRFRTLSRRSAAARAARSCR